MSFLQHVYNGLQLDGLPTVCQQYEQLHHAQRVLHLYLPQRARRPLSRPQPLHHTLPHVQGLQGLKLPGHDVFHSLPPLESQTASVRL